jgi:steroid delta-isomerase-like uncharacterized protein
MEEGWVEQYFKAWARHAQASDPRTGAAELALMLSFMSPDIRYEDVPTGLVFTGHDGVREMGAQALQMAADLHFTLISAQASGDQFAFETETRGTNTGAVGAIPATGKPFVLRGVSVGRRSSDGKVVSHKDYWDLAGYLRDIGLFSTTGANA